MAMAHSALATMPAARGESRPSSLPPAGLWDAIRRTVFTNGYVVDLAERVACSPKDLYRYSTDPANASDEHRAMPAALIVPLAQATGRLDVLEFLADECGCVLVRRPSVATASAGPLLARVAAVSTEFADVQRCAAVLLDGIAPSEASALDQQLTELVREAEALRLAVAMGTRKPSGKVGAR